MSDIATVQISISHLVPLLRLFFVYRFLFERDDRLVCKGESGEGEARSLRGARGARRRDGELEADSASRR